MKRKSFQGMASALSLGALTVIVLSGRGHAATFTKADNATALDQAASWGGTAPGAVDVANWSGTYNTVGSLSAALPAAALSWNGITCGTISGTAAGVVSVGGTAAATVGSGLALGAGGINLSGASQNLVLNAETLNLSTSQTWTVPSGRNLRLGSTVMTANVDGTGGSATVITVTGGGVVDANQGATNGFTDFTGKWVVDAGTTLRGVQNSFAAWGSNTDADAILLKGGKLATGVITNVGANWTWPNSIKLQTGTTSFISGQNLDTSTRSVNLTGTLSGDGNLVVEKLSGGTFRVSVDKEDNPLTGAVTINGVGAAIVSNVTVQASIGTTTGGTKTPLGTGVLTVNNGATLQFKPLGTATSTTAVTVANPIALNNATLSPTDALQTYTGTLTLTGANTLTSSVDLKHTTISGLIQDGASAGSLTIKSTGTQKMILPSANTFTGGTILGNTVSNSGIVVIGDRDALGSGPITLRGAQLWAATPGLTLSNALFVNQSLTAAGGGLCVGGTNDITFTQPAVVDNLSRPFLNSSAALVTLAGIDLSSGPAAVASFGSSTIKGPFLVSGAITGAGKVEVKGGTVTLTSPSSYSGTTAISSSGRLHLTGSLASNITLTGASAAISGAGTTTGSFTTSGTSGGMILLDPATPTQALTANAVSFTGPTKVELLNLQPLGKVTYSVIKYGTLTAGSLAQLSSTAARWEFADDAANKQVTLAVTTANLTWNRALSGNWNLTEDNWAEGDLKFCTGDAVTFGDTGAGTVAITGLLTPLWVAFNNSAGNNYTLTATAGNQLSGPGSMTKTGFGTVLLSGENKHTGKTTITGGTLAIPADNCLGTAPGVPVADQLGLDGGLLKVELAVAAAFTLHANRGITLGANGGAFDTFLVGNSATATIAGAISGSGPLVLRANGDTSDTGGFVPGAMALTGANTFTGPVTITSGVVTMTSLFGDGTNTVILNGGGIVNQEGNVSFSQPIQVGADGGVLRTYQSSTTSFSGSLANAIGVPTVTLRHTDGGTQNHAGDASGFSGTFTNSRGNINFDSPNWQGMSFVNVDGETARFRSGAVTQVRSITTDRDLHIETGTTLNVLSGNVTVPMVGIQNTLSQNFWIQNAGTLTSSSGTLTFDFQTPFTAAGADDQSVSVLIADYDAGTPLAVVKNGSGAINNFNQPNTYTGGTTVNAGRINVTNVLALGLGPATVKTGGQLYFSVGAGTYSNELTIEGSGPAETVGNLGAIRFANSTFNGNLTIAPAGARVVAYQGTGAINGTLGGTGDLELNSPSVGHNGAFTMGADGTAHTGTITLAQGSLNLTGTAGGAVTLANGTTLSGEGIINGKLSMGSTTGMTLRVNGTTTEALTANHPVLGGPCQVLLDSLPDPLAPITVLNYTTLTGTVADFHNAPTSLRRLAFTDTGTSITGEVVIASRTWAGSVNGAWDSTTLNWLEGDQRFFTGDTVLFTDAAVNKAVTIANPVSPAAVEVNNTTGNDFTITGKMTTPVGGNLVKRGTGNLTLLGTPSAIGGILEINGGRAILATTDYLRAVGAATGIVVNDTGILRLNGTNLLFDGNGTTPVTVNAGGVVELNGYHNHFKELILNGGTISGMRSDADTRYNNEYSTFDISVTVGGSQMSTITRVSGGTGVYYVNGAPFEVGDVTGGTDLLVNASLVGTGLTKNGPGTMTLTEVCSYGGGTTINGGTLLANSTSGSATGSGPVTVKTGATLGGTGVVGGAVTIESGGTLAPGVTIESLATGALTLLAGSTVAAEINSTGTPTADVVNVAGNVVLAGALTVADLAGTPQLVKTGDKLTVLTYTGTLTGTFVGLPEEATLTVGRNSFKIRYNDAKAVTLESLASAVDDYTTWASVYAPLGLPTADDDADGMTNREEYAFGLHPKNGASANPIPQLLSKTTGMFTYVRRNPTLTNLIYKVWTSPNLTTWTVDTAALQLPTDVGENQNVVVTLSGPKPLTAPELFVRVTAE